MKILNHVRVSFRCDNHDARHKFTSRAIDWYFAVDDSALQGKIEEYMRGARPAEIECLRYHLSRYTRNTDEVQRFFNEWHTDALALYHTMAYAQAVKANRYDEDSSVEFHRLAAQDVREVVDKVDTKQALARLRRLAAMIDALS